MEMGDIHMKSHTVWKQAAAEVGGEKAVALRPFLPSSFTLPPVFCLLPLHPLVCQAHAHQAPAPPHTYLTAPPWPGRLLMCQRDTDGLQMDQETETG